MKKIMLTLLSTGLLLTGCKKDTSVVLTGKADKKIKSLEYSNSSGTNYTDLYYYDSEGKLKEIRYKNETETFTYNSPVNFTVTRIRHADPTQFITDLYTLNNKGAVEKVETRYANGSVFSVSTYTYDQDNILQAIETAYPSQNTIFRFENTISNGIMSSRKFLINNVLQSWEEFSYDKSRPMKGYNQLTANNYFPGLYGAAQKYPLTEMKFFDVAGNLQETRSYTSVLDEEGYFISYTGNDLNSSNSFTFKLKY